MSNERKKQIENLAERLEEFTSEIRMYRKEESSAYNNMPENLREGPEGQQSRRALFSLGDAITAHTALIESLRKAATGSRIKE